MEELIETFEILIDAWIKSDNEDITVLANSLAKQAEKALIIDGVTKSFYCLTEGVYGKSSKCIEQCLACWKSLQNMVVI